ncbi:multidrug efflux RND transporter permease subunit [Neolewinella aurantiaca]|uniref:Multidrug efflux RND transporter permease subunit n=1 Tax=Neolewinella aurantiaca TaxID=2602767 RepID=A0A5C7FD75_9BACT|nr:multidrug efflux RND transporter permease subunit [Neolewinella aurantiaca]TXF88928.1 multidrug efflux RND transporter permease subunit [Neolewinella aurantiaca]
MNISHTFIDRPILATVIAIFIMLVGGLSYSSLPTAQYPEVAPPTINVSGNYPGANAETVAATVATPLEQEINGVENMLYMTSQSTSDGSVSINVTFKQGTDIDQAQVLVQNRVASASPRLPAQVSQVGITTNKVSPDLLLVVNLFSPDESFDQTYIANYAVLNMRDRISRLDGVGNVRLFGATAYSMRIWIDPSKLEARGITATEVIAQLRAQNVQVSGGTLNQSPSTEQSAFELSIQTKGRLETSTEFEDIILKTGEDGSVVRVRDIGRVEIGSESYVTRGLLDGRNAVAMPISQRPGSNAIETADAIKELMTEMSQDFPEGMAYEIAYNPTTFVEESIVEVQHTIYEAVFLVILVILLFLHSWRAAIIPIVAIPISLIGTFAVMSAMGFSLNNLSLFGLVLAIGIVVDDAIVVVENMERWLEEGLSPRDAARKTMTEVGGALIAMGLVLVAVFLPTMFIDGIAGSFYQQFGLTIATATIISVFVSLTLSPALARLLLRHKPKAKTDKPWYKRPLGAFANSFDRGMNKMAGRYGNIVGKFIRRTAIIGFVYLGLLALTAFEYDRVPSGFIPDQDQGYFITVIQLPAGASLSRTEEVVKATSDKIMAVDGVSHAIAFSGFDGATRTIASHTAAIFSPLEPFEERNAKGINYEDLLTNVRTAVGGNPDANVFTITPPPIRGIGNGGGFKMMVQDREGKGVHELAEATRALAAAANADPRLSAVFTVFNTNTPQLFLDVDREKAERLGVPVSDVFSTLATFIGSSYVNDFNYLGRTYRVTAQADAEFRAEPDDVERLQVRNKQGELVPLGTVANFETVAGPSRVQRYNLFTAAGLQGVPAPGVSSGEALAAMEEIAAQTLPDGFSFEWTELAYQQKQSSGTAGIAFLLAVLFVFLLLAAQFESWVLPLAVIMVVPMALFSALIGLDVFSFPNDVLTQIGMIVLIGLASKNAILIVEFAKQKEDEGMSLLEAAKEGAALRLRPILMTSFAFILGTVPLVIATGAGSEMRNSLGTAVFIGMIGVTIFGLFLTPVFYVVSRRLGMIRLPPKPAQPTVPTTSVDLPG